MVIVPFRTVIRGDFPAPLWLGRMELLPGFRYQVFNYVPFWNHLVSWTYSDVKADDCLWMRSDGLMRITRNPVA